MSKIKEKRLIEALIDLAETAEDKERIRTGYEADREAFMERVDRWVEGLVGPNPQPAVPAGASLTWTYGEGEEQEELVAEIDQLIIYPGRIAIAFRSEARDDRYEGVFALHEAGSHWVGAGTTIYGSQREQVEIHAAHRQPNGAIAGDWREQGALWRFELFLGGNEPGHEQDR